jgi:hypothetical protein
MYGIIDKNISSKQIWLSDPSHLTCNNSCEKYSTFSTGHGNLKMEAEKSSEITEHFYQSTRHYNPDYGKLLLVFMPPRLPRNINIKNYWFC